MGTLKYQARVTLVPGDDIDYMPEFPVSSFSVAGGTSVVYLGSTNSTKLLSELENAKTYKNITIFKPPSKDSLDAFLMGFADQKITFGFNLDLYAVYSQNKGSINIVHLFGGSDSAIKNKPIRVGDRKSPLLKVEVTLPDPEFKHAENRNGIWIDDDDWIR